ncbi:MAG: iron ABC transporter permease [Planctomycetes bacterium]|nr:iron ABC transporter permease [Planctomycetota bacterium]
MKKFYAFFIAIFTTLLLLPVFYMVFLGIAKPDTEFLRLVINDPRYRNLFFNSLTIGFFTSVFSVVLGFPLAYAIARIKLPFRRVIENVFLIPLLIPSYFLAIAWVFLAGDNGIITNALRTLPGVNIAVSPLYSTWGVILILTLSYFPLVTLLTLTGLRNIDLNLEKAGWLATSRFRAFTGISLPLILPYVLGSAILVFVLALNNFDVPSILLVNDIYPMEIFYQFSVFYKPERAMLLALPLILTAFAAIFAWYLLFKNRSIITIGSGWRAPEYPENGRIAGFSAFIFAALLMTVAVILPLAGLVAQARSVGAISGAFSLAYKEMLNSLIIAFITTVLSIVFGIIIAHAIERRTTRLKGPVLALLMVPLIVPGSAIGIGLIKMYNHGIFLWIYGTIFIVVLGLLARFIIIPVISISGAIKMMDPSLENAAAAHGAGYKRILAKIIFPLTGQAIIASAVLCFIFSLNELPVAIMVNPPGFNTISVRIYSLFHFGQEQAVAVLCLIMTGVTVVLYAILMLLFKRKGNSGHGN